MGEVALLTCKRKHGNWFMTKRFGRVTKFCEYIMGYQMKEGKGINVVFCGDLRKNSKLPSGFLPLTEVTR